MKGDPPPQNQICESAPLPWRSRKRQIFFNPAQCLPHSSSLRLCVSAVKLIFSIAVIISCLTAKTGFAQTTQPTAEKLSDLELESKPLNIDQATVHSATQHSAGSGSISSGIADTSQMMLALVAVIGMIFLLRWGARRMALVPAAGRSGAVKVISRSTVSPRQQVLVLQVGKRLVVVGDSAGQMHPLCEITDPDEVAAMIGGSRQDETALASRNPKSFMNLFSRATEPFEETATTTAEPMQNIEPVNETENEDVGSLLDKVRALRQEFRQTGS